MQVYCDMDKVHQHQMMDSCSQSQCLKYEKFNTAHSIIGCYQRQHIEAHNADQSMQNVEKIFCFHFSVIRMGSHGTFVL